MQFTGYAFLENGVGGDYLKLIRKSVESITNPDKKKDIERANKILDIAGRFVKAGLAFVKDSKVMAPYVTTIGLVLIGKGAALHYENENSLAPQIKVISPDYYRANIGPINDGVGGKFGGGGNTTDY